MQVIGDIVGHIAGTLNDDDFSLLRNAVNFITLLLNFQNDIALLGKNDFFQRKFFFQTASWIGVDLRVYQLRNCRCAVSGDLHSFTARHSHHFVAHHQQAVFLTHDELLHNDFGVVFFSQGNVKSRVDFCFGFQIE